MTEAAIDPGLTRDLYVSLGEPLGGGDWSLRLYYKPYVRWIWLGGIFMALGGILAITDRRYRTVRAKAAKRIKTDGSAPAAAGSKLMKSYLRFTIPLIIFGVIAAFLFKGMYMNPREIPSPLIGKSVPEFSLPLLEQPETHDHQQGSAGKTLSAECLGNLVCLLPGGTCHPGATGTHRPGGYLWPELEG